MLSAGDVFSFSLHTLSLFHADNRGMRDTLLIFNYGMGSFPVRARRSIGPM
jgi:hypothetical protein